MSKRWGRVLDNQNFKTRLPEKLLSSDTLDTKVSSPTTLLKSKGAKGPPPAPPPPTSPHSTPARGCRARGPTPLPPSPPRAPNSLLGRAPHRGSRLAPGHRFLALKRRGPRLPRRLLGTALPWPRSGLKHRPPTHGASAGGGAAGVRPPPRDPETLPSGGQAVAAAAALLPAGYRRFTGRFRTRHHRPPRDL